jgi:hypothetical protein
MRALACELQEAHRETARRLARARRAHSTRWSRVLDASALGRIAELAYAGYAGLAAGECLPRWIRGAIHGGGSRTTRDRGVDAVGIHTDGRLTLVQIKWYRERGVICSDAQMKLSLIGAVAQRSLGLTEPPHVQLVFRRGARTATSAPGTEHIEYIQLTDAELGMEFFTSVANNGHSLLNRGAVGPDCSDPAEAADDDPFAVYRYQARRGGALCAA